MQSNTPSLSYCTVYGYNPVIIYCTSYLKAKLHIIPKLICKISYEGVHVFLNRILDNKKWGGGRRRERKRDRERADHCDVHAGQQEERREVDSCWCCVGGRGWSRDLQDVNISGTPKISSSHLLVGGWSRDLSCLCVRHIIYFIAKH